MNRKSKKTIEKIKSGSKNIRFSDIVNLVEDLGFRAKKSTGGSHFKFKRPGIPEAFNLQDDCGKAKSYQLDQILEIIKKYNLEDE